MATKSTKRLKSQDGFPGDLNPKSPETKYMGYEPIFHTQPDYRITAVSRSLNWYNQFFDKKTAKELMSEYLERRERVQDARQVRRVADSDVIMTYGWLARMADRGLELLEHEQQALDNEIQRLLQSANKATVVETDDAPKAHRPNIQEIMRDRTREAAGEFEGMFDDFTTGEIKFEKTTRTMNILSEWNIQPQHISILTEAWRSKLTEFTELSETKDRELQEAYGNLSKTELKNIIKFIEQVLSDLNSYVSVKKASKAPRARKAVPVEKIVSKLKYMKTFEDKALKLKLESISPTKLHGASEAWVYDTAKRKLHHYVADEYSKSFTIKGNTILGFDKVQSEIKTLRKPGEQVKEVMGSKPAARKYFKDIKAVATAPNGRFNEQMIILKAF